MNYAPDMTQLSKITRATMQKDAERISKLHSWYKNVDWPSELFCIGFRVGEQPRNSDHPEVTNSQGTHLFIAPIYKADAFPRISIDNPVSVTQFFRGNEGSDTYPYVLPVYCKSNVFKAFMAERGLDWDLYTLDYEQQQALELPVYIAESQRIINDIVEKGCIIARGLGILDE